MGLWTSYYPYDVGPLTWGSDRQDHSMCRNHDPVCAPPAPGWVVLREAPGVLGMGDVTVHADDYYETYTGVLGRWVADQYLGRAFVLNPSSGGGGGGGGGGGR